MISARFALRWTAVGLLCALLLVAAAFLLRYSQRPAPSPHLVTVDDLAAAAEMPLNAQGQGTQIISNTTLVLTLQPYPARAGVTGTLSLVATSPDGRPATYVSPTLYIASVGRSGDREYPMPVQPDRSFAAAGVLFPTEASYRVRVGVYVGDDTPASILLTVPAGR